MDVTINPLSKAIGAEILGVDLSEKVDSEDLFHINLAMQKSLVLVFRNQKLEPNNLLSAVRLFGDTMEQHLTDTLMKNHPEIAVLDSREMPPDKEGKIIPFGGRDWHTDHTNHEVPPKFTVLYAIKLPNSGGDTSFANMHLAFDSLPQTNTPADTHASRHWAKSHLCAPREIGKNRRHGASRKSGHYSDSIR